MLDTHVVMWWVDGNLKKIPAAALAAINSEHPGGEIIMSSITAWEIAMLVALGRRTLSVEVKLYLENIGKIPGLTFIPVDNEIGIEAVNLPGEFHKDPADRLIVASARKFGAPIVTADEKIHGYRHVRTIW
jgi:PIN domain nuclease of toxin-antitoxin system